MNVDFNFQGKNAVVIGGSRGIGRQICLDFRESGASVVCVSRKMTKNMPGIQHVVCDVRNASEVKSCFDNLEQLDFLVNVVAINHCKKIGDISIEEWDDVLAVNLRSYFLTSKLAVEKMKKSGSGKIVNVSSIAGRSKSVVSGVHYTASKAGIIGLTRQMSYEVSRSNINVNAVCPSQTKTDMLIASMTPESMKALSNTIPIRRLASPKDQSLPVLFLCSDAAAYITGCVLDVNGGQL